MLQTELDKAARGMTSHDFAPDATKKVLVSGFDPFFLDSNILQGNPSGAAVLGLDNTTVSPAPPGCTLYPGYSGIHTCPQGPTAGAEAVEGGGGGYLSNEIAYRVTRLRAELSSPTRAGHVHTQYPVQAPAVSGGPYATERELIVSRYRQILNAGIAAS